MAATPDPNQPKRPQAKGDFVKGRIVRVMHGQTHTFTRVANTLVNNSCLSFKALGMAVYLLSKPDHWSMRIVELAKSHQDGRIAVQSARKELEQAGYLVVKPRRWKGQFGYVYIIFESPQLVQQSSDQETLFEKLCQEAMPGSTPAEPSLFASQTNERKAELIQSAMASAVAAVDPEKPAHKTCAGESGEKTSAQKPSTVNPSPENMRLVTTDGATTEQLTAAAFPARALGGVEKIEKAASDPEFERLRLALMTAGICGAAFNELLEAYPALTGGMVEREWERCREGGKRSGILIQNLRQQIVARRAKLAAIEARRTA